MTNFDTRLQTSLERLDAAIPAPRPPSVSDAAAAAAANSATRSTRRRRRVVFLIAAAALLVAASAVAGQRPTYPDVAQPVLEAAIVEVLDGDDGCISAADATPLIRARMDALGYADWDILLAGGAEEARCVGFGIVTPDHLVVIVGGIGREVAEAMRDVPDELMRRCLGKAEAVAYVTSVLASIGRTDIGVRADPGGPHAVPADQAAAYEAHVAAGCYVYSGIPDGKNVHLWGP